MSEADITLLMVSNREAMAGWILGAIVLTLGAFAIAYLVRNTPVWWRAVFFVLFAVTSINTYLTTTATNEAFLGLVQELSKLSQITAFSKATVDALGATPMQAPAFPLWFRITAPLTQLLSLVVGFYLYLLAKWER
jgi:hypothetical protein